ncbi:MAG: molybdopterin-containing oxidoreductase family protein [Desulfobaccales bacterium]
MQRHTVCRLCSACCPVIATVEDGRLVGAERQSPFPPEQRLVCPKLKAAPEILYSPDRLLTPLIRKKGSSDFRPASWEEALDLVAAKFQYFKEAHGPQTVAWLRGMAADWGAPWDYANRLMNLFGSPNTIGNGSVCHVGRDMAHCYTYGAMTLPQARNARAIVIWGKNDRNTAPGAAEAIIHARRQGAKLIVIDPVKTAFAAQADLWLRVKPGHDGQLAMALIHEIIAQGLYDADFVQDWCLGFEELKAAAARYPAAEVGPRLWLEPEAIREAARLYAGTKPACIIDGNGLDMHLQVFQATRAVCTLRALTGNLDKDGGDFIPQPVPLRNIQCRDRLPAGVAPVTQDYPLFNTFHETWGLHAQSCLIDAILEEKPYPVRMLVVQSGNPAVTMTDARRVQRALEKLEFLVVIDLFRTRTAQYADVILPAASCFEKTQLNRAFMRNSPVILQNQVIDWLGDSCPDWKILFDLGRRLGFEAEFPWQTAEEAIDYQLAPSGLTVAELREHPEGLRAAPLRFEKYRTEGFATPSGKVEFFSPRLAQAGQPPVPFLDGRPEAPLSFAGSLGEDALIGISGERSNRFTHTQFLRVPSLAQGESQGYVDVHPEDARRRNLVAGRMLTITTPRGRVRLPVRISEAVPPGVVRLGWGWGELDPEANINNLTDDDQRDPVTCTPSNRSFWCRLDI